jgi:hypothetical protein
MFRPASSWGRAIGTVLLAVLLALLPAGLIVAEPAARASAQEQRPTDFHSGLHAAMATMMDGMDAAPMTGNPEVDFLAMMIPHHEGAVEMARLVLLYGRDPLVRQLAEEIIVTQQVEITSMRNRLEVLQAGGAPDAAASQALGGTRGEPTPDAAPDHQHAP